MYLQTERIAFYLLNNFKIILFNFHKYQKILVFLKE